MAWSTEKTIAAVVGAAFVVLVVNATVSYQVTRRLVRTDERVVRSYEAITQLDVILAGVEDAETGQRGYLLTGQADYLIPYLHAYAHTSEALTREAGLLTDDALAEQRLRELRTAVTAKFGEMDSTLALWNSGQRQAAHALVLTNRGRDAMTRVRRAVLNLEGSQRRLLQARDAESVTSAAVALRSFLIANAIAALLLFLTLGVIMTAIKARRRAEERADAQRASLQAVLTSMADGVIVSDASDRVVFMNAMAEALTGISEAAAAGQGLGQVLRFTRAPDAFELAGQAGEVQERDPGLVVLRPGGQGTSVDVSRQPIRGERDPVDGGTVTVLRDATERRRLEADRARWLLTEQEARTRAEGANRAKDEFVAMISHEIRTPLNAILGWTHILRADAEDAPDRLRAIDIIERNARAQAALIDELLDISRIVTGKLHVERAAVDVAAVLAAALDAVRPLAEGKGVALAWTRAPGELVVMGDANRLQQVFTNLLTNGVKFTPRDGRIDVSLARRGEEVELGVHDTGAGITADFLPRVFDRFSQSEVASRRAHGGLGLGLAIARHIVELHHGVIRAASAGEGRGATFTVTLPAATASPSPAGPATDPRERGGAPLRGVRVLLVDDDDDSLDALRLLLAQRGAEVEARHSAGDALECLARWTPDVLLSDIGMPDEDGHALIEHVRALAEPRRARLPAIALTAFTSAEERSRALAAGFTRHIAKPASIDELVAGILALLREETPPGR